MSLVDMHSESHSTLMDSIQSLLRTSAAMYMYIAEEVIQRFGFRGERALRRHLRAYGKWRGTEMRLAHEALGLPTNVETLLRNWDSASGYATIDEEKASFSPNKVVLDVSFCPASEVWRASEFWRWGHMYCDELHEACTAAYNPDASVVIPENIMKGDPSCKFIWTMAPQRDINTSAPATELGRKLAAYYVPTSPHDAAVKALRRGSRIHAGRFFTLVRALEDALGADGVDAIRNGLRKWGSYRGRVLRNAHASLAYKRTVTRLFTRFDFPYQYLWEIEIKDVGEGNLIEIRYCPFADTWNDLEADRDMCMYCTESYTPLFQGYGLECTPKLTSCLCHGDDKCVFQISR